jgi:hypothetical protein
MQGACIAFGYSEVVGIAVVAVVVFLIVIVVGFASVVGDEWKDGMGCRCVPGCVLCVGTWTQMYGLLDCWVVRRQLHVEMGSYLMEVVDLKQVEDLVVPVNSETGFVMIEVVPDFDSDLVLVPDPVNNFAVAEPGLVEVAYGIVCTRLVASILLAASFACVLVVVTDAVVAIVVAIVVAVVAVVDEFVAPAMAVVIACELVPQLELELVWGQWCCLLPGHLWEH